VFGQDRIHNNLTDIGEVLRGMGEIYKLYLLINKLNFVLLIICV